MASISNQNIINHMLTVLCIISVLLSFAAISVLSEHVNDNSYDASQCICEHSITTINCDSHNQCVSITTCDKVVCS
jgi:competence protein ComGC